MKLKLLLLILFATKESWALEPTISIGFCKGEHEYIDGEGRCKGCEKCPTGYEPREYCGYGERHVNYSCKVCPLNSFSTRTDYNMCVLCKPCGSWNSETIHECTNHRDRLCGDCFSGYFRPVKSDGKLDDECHPCSIATENNPQCHEDIDNQHWWKRIAVVVIPIAGFLLILVITLLILYVCFCKNHRRRHRESKKIDRELKVEESNGTDTRESLLGDKMLVTNRDDSNDDSLETESVVQIVQESNHSVEQDHDSSKSTKSIHVISEIHGRKSEEMNSFPHPSSSVSNNVSDSGYSNMPTAEYVESVANRTPSFSNMPTRLFDDNQPSPNVNQRHSSHSSVNPPHSFRLPSRRLRPPLEVSSSSENLLENVDRDSKVVEGQRTLVDYVPEFFDTGSIGTDVTKPHKVV